MPRWRAWLSESRDCGRGVSQRRFLCRHVVLPGPGLHSDDGDLGSLGLKGGARLLGCHTRGAKGSEVRPEEAQLRVPGMASDGASEDSKGQAVAGSAGEEQDDPGSSHQSGRARDLGMGPGGWDSREERRWFH